MEQVKLPITLVMIVRNSGGRLKQVIEAHRDIVSEVVVVDQSSDDGTYEEALQYADMVVKRRNKGKCEGDRNYAFMLGNYPWVLNLDDDEFLTPESKANLPKALETGADIVWLKRDNLVDGVSLRHKMGDDIQCRLFKRGSVRWSDETHKFPEKADNASVLYSELVIEHRRTYEGILATHKRRSKVLEPDMLDLERKFVAMVAEELRLKKD